jgi:triosephosphate isomerase
VAAAIPIFAANWKMHHGPVATRAFVAAFVERFPARADRTLVFFPPAISVTAFVEAARGRPDLRVGVQDVHPEDAGAYTGAISAPMAREAGAAYALVGHSERRRHFGDTDEIVAAKLRAAVRNGLTAVLCVGETLEEREAGRAEATVGAQLEAALGADGLAFDRVWIAYEPVWAIGTGRHARPEDANAVHAFVRAWLAGRAGGLGKSVPVLYGGSVTPSNIAELLAQPDVDGVLVGGASLVPDSFAAICSADKPRRAV